MIRVKLPAYLRDLAHIEGSELLLEVDDPITQNSVLDAIEDMYPNLRGTIRDQNTKKRRAFVRFFACEEDLSHEPIDAILPEKVRTGEEIFYIIGAIAGG